MLKELKGVKVWFEKGHDYFEGTEKVYGTVISEPYPVVGSSYGSPERSGAEYSNTHSTTCVIVEDYQGNLHSDIPVNGINILKIFAANDPEGYSQFLAELEVLMGDYLRDREVLAQELNLNNRNKVNFILEDILPSDWESLSLKHLKYYFESIPECFIDKFMKGVFDYSSHTHTLVVGRGHYYYEGLEEDIVEILEGNLRIDQRVYSVDQSKKEKLESIIDRMVNGENKEFSKFLGGDLHMTEFERDFLNGLYEKLPEVC